MMLALLPLLVLSSSSTSSPSTSSPSSAAPPCAELSLLLALDDDAALAAAPQVWARLPTSIAQRLRADMAQRNADGDAPSSSAAVAPTRRAVALLCPALTDARRAQLQVERVRALARDERYVGTRDDDALADSVAARLGAFLEELLESEAMVAFSEQTRTVYLSLLAIVAVVLAWRLRRRPPLREAGAVAVAQRAHQQRALRVDELLADARSIVAAEPRRAALLVRQALLVRVGEVQHDDDVLSPARTTSEVCAGLDPSTAAIVRPALQHFDRVFFGGATTQQGALGLLDDVVATLERLVSR